MEGRMKSRARLMILALGWGAVLLMRPPAASAVPGKLTDDAYTVGTTSTNYGIVGVLHAIDSTNERSFIQFDLGDMTSTLPSVTAADVEKATLTLFVDGVGAAGSFDVYPVTSAWNEATITGASQPSIGSPSQATVSLTTGDARKFVVIDLTPLVKMWTRRPSAGCGSRSRTESW
jgi:hypothetical protein